MSATIQTALINREHYRMDVGRHDDAGYLFQWADDPEQEPAINQRLRLVEAGREWMRKHAPRQWAAFMAAKLLDRSTLRLLETHTRRAHLY